MNVAIVTLCHCRVVMRNAYLVWNTVVPGRWLSLLAKVNDRVITLYLLMPCWYRQLQDRTPVL